MERSVTGPHSLVSDGGAWGTAAAPASPQRAVEHAVFAIAVAPADLTRLRSIVAGEIADLVPHAAVALELCENPAGQDLLRRAATDPQPLHLILPLRADGLVVGVLSVRSELPLTSTQDDVVRRLSEVIARRMTDAVHGTPQERATVEALRTREQQLLAAQRMASITVWHWRIAENAIDWLDAQGRDLGLDGLGKTQEDYLAGIHPDDVEEHNRRLLSLLAAPGSAEVELRYRWGDGWRNWHLWAESVADERGVVQSLWGTTQDVTEQRAAQEAIRRLAVTDSLTGLANRTHLQAELDAALSHGGACALLLLDLDRFKAVNDTLGHLVGDQLLVELGRRLAAFDGDGRIVGRLGGDEFLVVLPRGDLRAAAALADAVMAAIEQPVDVAGHAEALYARASIGLSATRGRPGVTTNDLYREADVALYAAKDAGRGRTAAYDQALAELTGERLEIEATLRAALSNNHVRPLYQPIIALGDSAEQDRLVGCEALARLGSSGPSISPVTFVPIAEETGLIAALDEAVFTRAAHEVLLPDRNRGGNLTVAVNLSPRSLQVPGLADRLTPTLAALGLDGRSLSIEITESSLAEPTPTLLGTLRSLQEIGAGVGIDDFGTGYSALSYLQRFDLEFLKVDRSFVARSSHDATARAVIRALVDLAHAHDLTVVAEGIETVEQLEIVRELGCDKAQGFLLGRPMPAEQLLARDR
jgi:diguanylate cyclase (GGDEF)-like protein